jgi:hypothetical protein
MAESKSHSFWSWRSVLDTKNLPFWQVFWNREDARLLLVEGKGRSQHPCRMLAEPPGLTSWLSPTVTLGECMQQISLYLPPKDLLNWKNSEGMGWDQRSCIANKLPDERVAAGVGPHTEEQGSRDACFSSSACTTGGSSSSDVSHLPVCQRQWWPAFGAGHSHLCYFYWA